MDDRKQIPKGTLTMEDMSFVLDDESQTPDDVRAKLQQDILGDSRYAEMFEEGEQARRDAGIHKLWEAFCRLADLDKLLAAEDWDDPAEVLMPGEEDTSTLRHRALIALCDARIERGEDRERLLAVKERLERHEEKFVEEALKSLVWEVGRLSPRSAARMIEKTAAAMDEVPGSR